MPSGYCDDKRRQELFVPALSCFVILSPLRRLARFHDPPRFMSRAVDIIFKARVCGCHAPNAQNRAVPERAPERAVPMSLILWVFDNLRPSQRHQDSISLSRCHKGVNDKQMATMPNTHPYTDAPYSCK